jgi:hypothetical protein
MFLASDAPVPTGDLESDFRARLRELDVSHVVIHLAMLNDERRRGVLDLVAGMRELERQYEDHEVVLFGRADTSSAIGHGGTATDR